jgi:hypothetical protein
VRNLKQAIRQAQAVKHLENAWMNGVAAELAVKVVVRFEQRHVHLLAREQVGKRQPGRPPADDAARRFLRVENLVWLNLVRVGFGRWTLSVEHLGLTGGVR